MAEALPELLTVDEVASALRIDRKTLLNWRALGRAPEGFRVGRAVLFPRDGVRKWLDAQRAADEIGARTA